MIRLLLCLLRIIVFGTTKAPARCLKQNCWRGELIRPLAALYCHNGLCDGCCENLCGCLQLLVKERA